MSEIKEHQMNQEPEFISPDYKNSGKLEGKVALVTGGDSGIGKAVAIHYAKEGADVAIFYNDSHEDATETVSLIQACGVKGKAYALDISQKNQVTAAIQQVKDDIGGIDILVNNAGIQKPQESLLDITQEQLIKTFGVNIFGFFYTTQAVLPQLSAGSSIINTASVVAYHGHEVLIDYAATKGAIVGFTRSLALSLADKNIRVNGVAPGPIWTPLIPSTFPKEKAKNFGEHTPLNRAGQPAEVAPAYVYLASQDSSYVTGQFIHVNGGEIVGG